MTMNSNEERRRAGCPRHRRPGILPGANRLHFSLPGLKKSRRRSGCLSLIAVLLASAVPARAQVPQLINYQGRVAVGGVNFDGDGQFKFALVDGTAAGGGGAVVTRQATATATLTGGAVTSVPVTDGGAGYTTPPGVRMVCATGGGATVYCVVSGGAVTSIPIVQSANGGYSGIVSERGMDLVDGSPIAWLCGGNWVNQASLEAIDWISGLASPYDFTTTTGFRYTRNASQ